MAFPKSRMNWPLTLSHPIAKDINITLMRTPEEVMNDKRVFMNQGEWELLHVLSTYNKFSIDNDDFYAEMKFTVSNVIIPN